MGIHITLTPERYYINRKQFGSKVPMGNKDLLSYLNKCAGLKEEITSFSVEGTGIAYPPIIKKKRKQVK